MKHKRFTGTCSDGALPKFKLLVGLALDAAMGSDQGVKSLLKGNSGSATKLLR
jgi:hypothetical protein